MGAGSVEVGGFSVFLVVCMDFGEVEAYRYRERERGAEVRSVGEKEGRVRSRVEGVDARWRREAVR